ncbi:MAG: hypothetical protein ABIH34_06105 [Nanoarchaeota archaeon]
MKQKNKSETIMYYIVSALLILLLSFTVSAQYEHCAKADVEGGGMHPRPPQVIDIHEYDGHPYGDMFFSAYGRDPNLDRLRYIQIELYLNQGFYPGWLTIGIPQVWYYMSDNITGHVRALFRSNQLGYTGFAVVRARAYTNYDGWGPYYREGPFYIDNGDMSQTFHAVCNQQSCEMIPGDGENQCVIDEDCMWNDPATNSTFTWSACTSIHVSSCDEYCQSIGKVCGEKCTTSRGYEKWGAEAWRSGDICTFGVNGQGQERCSDTELYAYDQSRWKCCCGG